MKILIINLSDLHFTSFNNSLDEKKEFLVNAISTNDNDADAYFIVTTGDIALSGLEDEYLNATDFFNYLKEEIEKKVGKEVFLIFSPGNHDCDFNISRIKVREMLIHNIHKSKELDVDDEVIDQCCDVQKNYREFESLFCSEYKKDIELALFMKLNFNLGETKISFSIFNTSWMSLKHEEKGKLLFPLKNIQDLDKNKNCDLSIALFHHPLNWQTIINEDSLKKYIESKNDFILTGHEHTPNYYQKDNLRNNTDNLYIESNVLQDSNNSDNSGFNILSINTDKKEFVIKEYNWDGKIYNKKNTTAHRKYRGNISSNSMSSNFKNYLVDAGADFKHPEVDRIFLNDIYIYPDLRDLKRDRSSDRKVFNGITSSDTLIENSLLNKKIILTGADKSGKTSLLKQIYQKIHSTNNTPVLLDGKELKSSNLDEFNKTLLTSYLNQYSSNESEYFNQLDTNKKFVIIDNFNKSKMNTKAKIKFLENILTKYTNIVITIDELFQFEEFLLKAKDKIISYDEFDHYEIIEFGHKLRYNVIDSWNRLGSDEFIEEDEIIRKNDFAKSIIDTIIGKNYIPSYPFFILTIIQTIEAGNPHQLQDSGYGHYYQFLIIQALSKINTNNHMIELYINYLTELAYFMYKNKSKEITQSDVLEFHNWFCFDEYKVDKSTSEIISFERLYTNLTKAFIILKVNDCQKFRYNYLYYFFLGRYFSFNLNESKDIISELCSALHVKENANILTFITHHNKDQFIIDEIIKNTEMLFPNRRLQKFEGDIEYVNNLTEHLPQITFNKDTQVISYRNKKLKEKDSKEYEDNYIEPVLTDKSVATTNDSLELSTKINLSFKTIEIIGRILKNHYGSLKAKQRYELATQAYNLTLRILNFFFELLEQKGMEEIVGNINNIITHYKEKEMKKIENKVNSNEQKNKEIIARRVEDKYLDKNKIENLAKNILYHITEMVSFGMFKKLSDAIGYEMLSETFKEILEQNNFVSTKLINISIKLDHFKHFPYKDIEEIKNSNPKNKLAFSILKKMVLNYLYMYNNSYKEKQKICNLVGISIDSQRYIEQTSTRKKG